jgi:hypothetical protein
MNGMTDSERQVEAALDADRRSKNCLVDVQNVLKRWNCVIDPMVMVSTKGVMVSWGVIALMVEKVQ